ncbi:unnamed protein product [Alternaria alternata]
MPYSPSDAYKNTPNHPNQQQQRASQMPRNQQNGNSGGTGYRGTAAPIAPYAFNSTPQLRQENKPVSAPAPQAQQQPPSHASQARFGHPSHPSSSSDSTVSTSGSSNRSSAGPPAGARDEREVRKPYDTVAANHHTIHLHTRSFAFDRRIIAGEALSRAISTRRWTDRLVQQHPHGCHYPTQRSTSGGNSHMGPSQPTQNEGTGAVSFPPPFRPGHNRANKDAVSTDSKETAPLPLTLQHCRPAGTGQSTTLSANTTNTSNSNRTGSRPASSHSHERQGSGVVLLQQLLEIAVNTQRSYASVAGGSSSKAPEPNRRQAPSPLSHPVSPSEPASPAKAAALPSTAMQHLSAVNDKDKGMNISAERARLRKDKYQNDEDAEQAAIIAKQEAAGIGAGIYSGQGASVMLRKMGHGMKKGTKSIKGLFRPKSVIGVPAADGPITRPSVGQVSLVTVEAERQKVNVNAKPNEQTGGGTGYPRLERNSIDAGRSAEIVNPSVLGGEAVSRKSIVGNDRDRAEVLL